MIITEYYRFKSLAKLIGQCGLLRGSHGWLRSQSQWLSYLLFMPSKQFSGLFSYPEGNDEAYKAQRHFCEEQMKYCVPPKYRDKVGYMHLPAEPEFPDPNQRLGYVGWNYNP